MSESETLEFADGGRPIKIAWKGVFYNGTEKS